MRDEHPRTLSLATVRRRTQPANSSAGFTLLEIMVVLTIALIMLKISMPIINSSMSNLHLGSSATNLAGAIQSARYQAISTGCPMQVAVLYARQSGQQTYQVSAESITGTPPACSATFVNYCQNSSLTVCPVPFTTSEITVTSVAGIALSATTPSVSVQLNPSGTVSIVGSAVSAPYLLVLSQANGGETKTVNVSGVGYVKVTAP